MCEHKVAIDKDAGTSQEILTPTTSAMPTPIVDNNTNNANNTSNALVLTLLILYGQGFMKMLVDYLCRIWEPPKEPGEKEATMKTWNSLALGCVFGSISILCSSGIAASIVPFLAHHKELSEAMSRMSSFIFFILVVLIFAFSFVLFGITKTNSCSDRLIKIANIIGALLVLLLTLILVTVACMVGALLPFLGTLVAAGVGVGIIFYRIPR